MTSALAFGFYARYQCQLDNGMKENEFVYVYFGPLAAHLRPDPAEISAVDFLTVAEIGRRIKREPAAYTCWLKHYFHNHADEIARLATEVAGSALPERAHATSRS